MVRRRFLIDREPAASSDLRGEIERFSSPLATDADLDPLLQRIGQAHYVLLGEASHGTSEYYAWRAAISRHLIQEMGFSFIAVEGDWPDCFRVNRFVKGHADAGQDAREVLHSFARWPTWMWANEEVVDLATWLREHNDRLDDDSKVGFYGLDVYSLWDSLYAVMGYLRKNRPQLLPEAQQAFACFEPYGEDVRGYGYSTTWLDETCEEEVVALLSQMRRGISLARDGSREAQFDADQNALVVKNAEHYYRTMVRGGPDSWNVRDRHMDETLERVMVAHGEGAKGVVWEHNTHIGDARYTDMAQDGMLNLGQLARENHDEGDVVLVGFGSYEGTVIAGRQWEAPWRRMQVPPARRGSWEDVLHQAGGDRLLVFPTDHAAEPLSDIRGHRAIGVVYHPESEHGNYVPTVLPRRYDAFCFLDRTTALHPLAEVQPTEHRDLPETFPTGV